MRPRRIPSSTVVRWLRWLIAISGGWAGLVLVTGGFDARLGFIRLSSTDPVRPALLAGLAFTGYWALIGPDARRTRLRAFNAAVTRVAPLLAMAAAATAGVIGIAYGTFVASGSDSSGYVSQAALWLSGSLHVPVPLTDLVTWSDRPEWVFTPLGYRPSIEPGYLVPTYAAGLPVVMAVFQALAGPTAVFYVVPVAGAITVGLTYRLARLLTGPATAAASAWLMLAAPVFLYQSVWPMSDVPVTAWWLAAILLAWSSRTWRGYLGVGLLVSMALLTRPNLVPLAVAVAATPLFRLRRLDRSVPAAAACALGMLPGIAAITALNAHLYGSPLQSGYGSLASIYALENIMPNIRLYGSWLVETHTPLMLVGFLAPALSLSGGRLANGDARTFALSSLLFTVLLVGCYLPYLQFDSWTYLRFLLPALPLLIVLTLAVFRRFLDRFVPVGGTTALAAATGCLVILGFAEARDRASFDVHLHENRYRDAVRWATTELPEGTIVFAMQHSGSLTFYTEFPVARYDQVGGRLDDFVGHLAGTGRGATLIIDQWEADVIRQSYGSTSSLARLDWTPTTIVEGVLAYDLTDRLRTTGRIP